MKIFNINLHKLSYPDFLNEILKLDKQNIVFTPNPEILLKAKSDQEFANFLKQANFLTPDGIGLYIGFQILDCSSKILSFLLLPYYIFNILFRKKYLYKKYGDRICGSDLTQDTVLHAEKKGIQITIIDLYNPLDIKKVNSQNNFPNLLKQKFPNLVFDYIIYNPTKKEEIIDKISKSESRILFSTLGMKKQEKSVIEVMEKCKNIKLGLGIGSSFDYFIGFQKRAPKIFRIIGFEWLYRLFTGPKKIQRLKRLYNATFVFIYEIFKKT